ncbi:MAG: hypothetical protein GF365_02490 [Candidatus Buchananbacteria bacterium]|nr:hypothetical protein [Candidatus Buchananbacteria bacterium]
MKLEVSKDHQNPLSKMVTTLNISGEDCVQVIVRKPLTTMVNQKVRLDVDGQGELIITCFEPVKIINQFKKENK